MSIRVKLQFRTLPPRRRPAPVYSIRLLARVVFAKAQGFTQPYTAIIDTGAPVSLIPESIWEQCDVQKFGDDKIRGIVPKEDCALAVAAGQIRCVLFDDQNETPELFCRADLAYSDEVPLLLGFKDLLERMNVCFDYSHKNAFIEI